MTSGSNGDDDQPALESGAPRPLVPVWATNLALILLILALWPLNSVFENRLNPYYFQILIAIGINIILAVSLNLINGITGQFSLGHAGFMAVGAYIGGYVSVLGSQRLALPAPAIFVLSLLTAALFAGIAGWIVGLPSLRL